MEDFDAQEWFEQIESAVIDLLDEYRTPCPDHIECDLMEVISDETKISISDDKSRISAEITGIAKPIIDDRESDASVDNQWGVASISFACSSESPYDIIGSSIKDLNNT